MEKSALNELRIAFLKFLLVERNCSDKTISSYNNDLVKFYEYLFDNEINNFKMVDKNVVRIFFLKLKEKNLSNRSIGRYYSSLNKFFKYLLEHEIIEQNPLELIDYPRYEKKVPEHVYTSKIKDLLSATTSNNNYIEIRNKLIVNLLLDSGMRVSELVNVKVKDIDDVDRTIKVNGKGNKERLVFYTKRTKKILNEWFLLHKSNTISEYLLVNYRGDQLSVRSVQKIIKKIGEQIGLDIHPHMIRHTFATELLNRGADIRMIQELLGHENLNTTQIYTHISNSHVREVYDYSHQSKKNK